MARQPIDDKTAGNAAASTPTPSTCARAVPLHAARDLLQVKYEMLRRVREEGEPVSAAATRFGLRPTFYTAQRAYETGGLPALRASTSAQARRGGGRGAPAFGTATIAEFAELVREFGLSVNTTATPVNGARHHSGPATSYERLRGQAVRAGTVRDREAGVSQCPRHAARGGGRRHAASPGAVAGRRGNARGRHPVDDGPPAHGGEDGMNEVHRKVTAAI